MQVTVHGASVNAGLPVARIRFRNAAAAIRIKEQVLQPIAGAVPLHSVWHPSTKPPEASTEVPGGATVLFDLRYFTLAESSGLAV